ncbi:MAG TPA: restriction endonuclease subunit R [Cyanobacteria bacterium UBA8803]|nr:restriction endonuclease subunit R [Cyanobacteria bacterium UBA8803]
MVQIIQAEKVTLYDLVNKFHLRLSQDKYFFPEWQGELPEITDGERQRLERVKESYFNLTMRPMLEEMVKMVVLSPLLDMAGFYLPPFYSTSEESVEILDDDEGVVVKGKIDVLVLQARFWIIVIESKRAKFSLEPGIPQTLAYMLANPNPEKPLFGLVTNGSNFIFLKFVKQEVPYYALSDEFTLRRGNDLYTVLAILKHLGQVLIEGN